VYPDPQPAFRLGTNTTLDQRADAHNLIKTVPVEQLCTYLLPRMYILHNMSPEVCGTALAISLLLGQMFLDSLKVFQQY
jgi:hypothetical protein